MAGGKVMVVGAIDRQTLGEIRGQPVVIILPDNIEDLRAFGKFLYERVELVAELPNSVAPGDAPKEGT